MSGNLTSHVGLFEANFVGPGYLKGRMPGNLKTKTKHVELEIWNVGYIEGNNRLVSHVGQLERPRVFRETRRLGSTLSPFSGTFTRPSKDL